MNDKPDSLALALLKTENYNDAITQYKKLWALSDKEEYRQKIAYCYRQKAISFAYRAMYQQACSLWEQHQAFSQPPYQGYDQYIVWLIHINSPTVQVHLKQLAAEQLDKDYPSLANVLGLLILTTHPELERNLTKNCIFLTHLDIIKQVFALFHDTERVKSLLKQLPYRSAFRELKLLLNAIIHHKITELHAKTSATSLYYPLINLLYVYQLQGSQLAHALIKLNHPQRQTIYQLKQFTQGQIELLEQFIIHSTQLTDEIQFDLAIQFQTSSTHDLNRQFCQRLLMNYPSGEKTFNQHFKTYLTTFEYHRLTALAYEEKNDLTSQTHWQHCLTILKQDPTHNNFKIALILRRMTVKEPNDEIRIDLLSQSLEYDPNNVESYLSINAYYSQQSTQSTQYQHWLAKSLEHFPQNIDLLTATIKVALTQYYPAEACQYATHLLSIDPLNSFAKQSLFSSHLLYAQQLLHDKQYHLVEQEITLAKSFAANPNNHQQVQLIHAVFTWLNTEHQQSLQKIIIQLKIMNSDPVYNHFEATMLGLINNFPVEKLLQNLPDITEVVLTEPTLAALIKQLNFYSTHEKNQPYLQEALATIKTPFENSLLSQHYTEAILLELCQLFDSMNQFELLQQCVISYYQQFNTESQQQPKAIWIYYKIYTDSHGNISKLTHYDEHRLNVAIETAKQDNDPRTILLIKALLDQYFSHHSQLNNHDYDFNEIEDTEDDFLIHQLFKHISDENFNRLNDKTDELAMDLTPDNLIHDLFKHRNDGEEMMVAVMKKPDIFTALLLIKAAELLEIEINVSIDQIKESFKL